MTHSYFSTMGVLFQPRDSRQGKSDQQIMASYKWMSQYTLEFLDAFIRQDSNAKKWLTQSPVENGVTENVITKVGVKNSIEKMSSFNDFNEMAAKQNYDNLYALYKEFLKLNPNFEI